jgi:DNA repair exonuclease SbcCD ATPase subunit
MAQDETRRAGILSFLKRLSDVFVQVVIISHIDETRYIADTIIEIEHDDASDCSRVKQGISAIENSQPGPTERAVA